MVVYLVIGEYGDNDNYMEVYVDRMKAYRAALDWCLEQLGLDRDIAIPDEELEDAVADYADALQNDTDKVCRVEVFTVFE
jgi:hypothetical protein